MDNFFSNAFDYSMFKKAIKETSGESIIINISSTDSSLFAPAKKSNNKSNQARKSMSSKFEPSPFGKFFGSKKRSSNPIDMSEFKSWKSKNYRGAEESLDKSYESYNHFSLSSFMQENSNDKFNELDQARFDLQKPIEQLPIDDPKLKKFSLDSYMHKLEESILAKDKFSINDDLLEPIVSDNNKEEEEFRQVSRSINKFQQDEDFDTMDINFEKFAFDDNIKGSEFSLDQDELDKVKKRLERMEKHSQKNEEKPTELLLPDGFDIDGEDVEEKEPEPEPIDPVDNLFSERTEGTKTVEQSDDIGKSSRGKKLNEVVINKDVDKAPNVSVKRPILFTTNIEEPVEEEPEIIEESEIVTDVAQEKEDDVLKKSDVLTKEDFKDITQDFMSKFSELYKAATTKQEQPTPQQQAPLFKPFNAPTTETYTQPAETYYPPLVEEYPVEQPYQAPQQTIDQQELIDYKNAHTQLQMKIHELVEDKYKTDKETEEKLKKIEEERNKIDEEYKNKLKSMEETYSKKYEEFKQKMYLDKAIQEKQVKENEEKIKVRTLESSKSKNVAEILKKELNSYFELSNLEMEKKLLETSTKIEKEENQKLKDLISQKTAENTNVIEESVQEVTEEVEVLPEKEIQKASETKQPQTPKNAPKKTTKTRTRKSKSRKIDKDIIGGINF